MSAYHHVTAKAHEPRDQHTPFGAILDVCLGAHDALDDLHGQPDDVVPADFPTNQERGEKDEL